MAKNTSMALRNSIVYSVFVRQQTPEGTFRALEGDLDRIRDLGTDIIWLMPIYPIGEAERKGTLGSPYAIRDYKGINPELGDLSDFIHLVDEIHARDMKVVLDIVFNHTSPDAVYTQTHPEWYYKKNGTFGNRVGDWYDIIDLDYDQEGLWEAQTEVLCYWAQYVDGFRCDVAPLVPIMFWKKAREAVEKIRPGSIWIAETIEPEFAAYLRKNDVHPNTDKALYKVFDVEYDYDIRSRLEGYLKNETHHINALRFYARGMQHQEETYPANFLKLRFLENHDRDRIAALEPDARKRRNWTAFLYFAHGTTLLYGGQEFSCTHTPSLFDKDVIDRTSGEDITPFLQELLTIRHLPILREGQFDVQARNESMLIASYSQGSKTLFGFFCVGDNSEKIEIDESIAKCENLLSCEAVERRGYRYFLTGEPLICWVK